ncbi:putative ATP/GTP-binding protein [Halorhodospira halochloris]|uniref:ATP/GTP-binding protein n=1 Tax=Halorhodospira halochloris TaxID=1052 RepID=A0A110B5D8_HALHR|nr:ATP-binding protein [Halorhodospira halochloris]MBK1652622.1 AAA family ATPase [Halorhodospira halochloris]BAU57928.1 putative ATP/GTP-binding protein [Halorhodospira halochloris]
MTKPTRVLERVEGLIERLEQIIDTPNAEPDWSTATAFRWRCASRFGHCKLEPIRRPHRIDIANLHGIEQQKQTLERNTRQHLAGLPANNALLWGARGTGKSSLIKALHSSYAEHGLRVIEVEPEHLGDLPDILELTAERPERFVIFCDDLSFNANDQQYRALKAVLDGSLTSSADNTLLYVTSNRRHLVPEQMQDNQQARVYDNEIHPGDSVEERISLAERFGIRLSFHPFDQERYLQICRAWLEHLGHRDPAGERVRRAALAYALDRGSRSGRVAWQFARDWAGRHQLGEEHLD